MATLKTIKVGSHRGSSRIWLQGKWLLGWFNGCSHFSTTYTSTEITIKHAKPDDQGSRKTTVNARGAIIDLVSASVGESLGSASQATVKITAQTITITPA